jgi:hypothetical protein
MIMPHLSPISKQQDLVGEIKRMLQATGCHALLPRHYGTVRG